MRKGTVLNENFQCSFILFLLPCKCNFLLICIHIICIVNMKDTSTFMHMLFKRQRPSRLRVFNSVKLVNLSYPVHSTVVVNTF